MAAETKRKQFHYRKTSFLNPVGLTLQELVESALTKLTPVKNRFERLTDDNFLDEKWNRFVNTHRAAMGMQFGNVFLYVEDQNRMTLEIDDTADELNVEQIAPQKSDNGKRREFLDSILYYGIKGNHVVILQSMSLRARELELHLNWLLHEANLIDKQNAVYLNNFTPRMTSEKMENAEVKSVKLGTPLYDHYGQLPNSERNDKTKNKYQPFGEGIDILNVLAPKRFPTLSWNELEASSNLEVFVEVTYKRQTDENSQQLLNNLTTALRNAGDEDMRIELKNGSVISGSELQIKGFKSISAYNGILDPSDVFSKMNEWLLENLEQGIIDAE